GLPDLAVKKIGGGARPERRAPGKPQQNGRLERLHLSLLQDTAKPPARSLRQQLERFSPMKSVRTRRWGTTRLLSTIASRREPGTGSCANRNTAAKLQSGVSVTTARSSGEATRATSVLPSSASRP